MKKDEVINRLCNMMNQAWEEIDPFAHEPCDCVCEDKGVRYQNAGKALDFMQVALVEAINRRRASASVSEATKCEGCDGHGITMPSQADPLGDVCPECHGKGASPTGGEESPTPKHGEALPWVKRAAEARDLADEEADRRTSEAPPRQSLDHVALRNLRDTLLAWDRGNAPTSALFDAIGQANAVLIEHRPNDAKPSPGDRVLVPGRVERHFPDGTSRILFDDPPGDGVFRTVATEILRPEQRADYPRNRAPLTHVAIRFRDKVWSLPRPYRHHHVIRMICWLDPDVDHVDGHGDDQGFLDATGRYLTRKQAFVSASENDQIKNGKIIGGVLTSEDLW